MDMHMDGAWGKFWIKWQNFIALHIKWFGPKFFQISSMGKKVPFWQFFRMGWDGHALLGQPSKGHLYRILILFLQCSTTLLPPHIKKLETYFDLIYFWTFAQCVYSLIMWQMVRTKHIFHKKYQSFTSKETDSNYNCMLI